MSETLRLGEFAPSDLEVERAERELDGQGVVLPLQSRREWGRILGGAHHRMLIAADASGRAIGMMGVGVTGTRALPGHRVARVDSVGDAYASPTGKALLERLTQFGRMNSRVLRVVVELECRTDEARTTLAGWLRDLGYSRIPSERVSERTLLIDLAPDEEQIFAAFGRTTRQNIRSVAKHGLELASLDFPNLSARMNALLQLSMARTGADADEMDWPSIMKLSAALPHRSRVVGVFRGAGREEEDLVGYAWGLHHGDRVEYHTGASARITGVRLPVLYPALWDLISWGKRTGGTWFDLGGVTAGTVGSSDALGGISDFKRGFSKHEIALGEEWAFSPSPMKARISSWASSLADAARNARRARRSAAAAVVPPNDSGRAASDRSHAEANEKDGARGEFATPSPRREHDAAPPESSGR